MPLKLHFSPRISLKRVKKRTLFNSLKLPATYDKSPVNIEYSQIEVSGLRVEVD
ncbi:MAG: hypothetical protein ACI84K_001796 [Pseudohongiellaceae bacterium]|jgi:hypothetical protein